MYSLQQIKSKLKDFGLKATHQRIVVFDVLSKNKNHPTAEQIYEELHKNYPSISLGTVYKTLDTLVDKGMINKVLSPNSTKRYDADIAAHHHIHCDNTEEIIDFEDEGLNALIQEYLSKKNITNLAVKDVRLHISGTKINPQEEVKII